MTVEQGLFYLLSAVVIAGSLMVVSTKNLLHSVLSAFMVLVATSGFYFLLNAQFLGVVQVLVYAGAVTILVLFVVMLTTAGPQYRVMFEGGINWLMLLFGGLFFATVAFVIWQVRWRVSAVSLKGVTNGLAMRIFLEYLLPFEVASILLLAALVGAIVLARSE